MLLADMSGHGASVAPVAVPLRDLKRENMKAHFPSKSADTSIEVQGLPHSGKARSAINACAVFRPLIMAP